MTSGQIFDVPELREVAAEDADDRGDWQHEVKRDKALDRIAKLEAENERLREALDTLMLVIGLTPVLGNKEALQQAVGEARRLLEEKP